jgi:hypothetical protein
MPSTAKTTVAAPDGASIADAAVVRAGRERTVVVLAFLVVAALPLAAYASLVLHQIYIQGSFFWDVGLVAFLMSQGDPSLPTPHLFGGESFYATHVSPILSLVTLIARLLPVSMSTFFAGFIGVAHALPAVGVLWLLVENYRLRRPMAIAGAALLGLAFAFGGLALAIARYPHLEMLTAGSAILFIAALLTQRLVIAGLAFTLCLATREDAGFHLLALLSVFLALDLWRGVRRPIWRATLAFAALALFYSAAALAAQSMLFPAHGSSFARVYLGHPAFADITPQTVFIRVLTYVVYRTYVVLPAAIALGWAVLARNPYILAGYVAVIPWTLLHLAAAAPLAATLSSYYAFPFMIASFWPLAAGLIGPRPASAAPAMAGFALMIAGSFTALSSQHNPSGMRLPAAFLSPPSASERLSVEQAVAALVKAKPALGRVLVDGSVLALAPNDFAWNEIVLGAPADPPDTVTYFTHGYEAAEARALAAKARLDKAYIVPGTPIAIASNRSLTGLEGLGGVIRVAEVGSIGAAPPSE